MTDWITSVCLRTSDGLTPLHWSYHETVGQAIAQAQCYRQQYIDCEQYVVQVTETQPSPKPIPLRVSLALGILVGLLLGCTDRQHVWVMPPDTSQQQRDRDLHECQLVGWTVITPEQQACLTARGYRRQ